MEITLKQLAALTHGTVLQGDSEMMLTGFAGLRESGPGDLSFCSADRYLNDLRKTRASAVLVRHGLSETIPGVALVACEDVSVAFGSVVNRFRPPAREFKPGIHPSAVVHPGAKLNPDKVSVGTCAVIGQGAAIGDGTDIGSGCVVEEGVTIGRDCVLFPNVAVYRYCVLGDRVRLHSGAVIGADGFGYEFHEGRHRKVDQVGIVEIGNDVEIGANSTVDRARFGRTSIGDGSKIDNQVMIAHNCSIGRHVIVLAQTGIAGSTRVGDHCIIAAQAGVGGHLEIAPQVTIAARGGVTRNIPEKGTYSGHPVYPLKIYQEQQIRTRNLQALIERVGRLERTFQGRSSHQGDSAGKD